MTRVTEHERQAIVDGEHLRVLSICYYVSAAVGVVLSFFALLYAGLGMVIATNMLEMPQQPGVGPPPAFLSAMMVGFGVTFFVIGIGGVILQFIAARRLTQRRSRILCEVAAAVTCLNIPYGTIIGVCTFVVLSRKSVIALFDAQASAGSLTSRGPDTV
jgi:hypothetical protein